MPDSFEGVGEILRPFLMRINTIDVIIKRIGGLNMLTTPLGDIEIYIDDKKIEYVERNIRKPDKLCPDVDGRYSIEVNFLPDGKFHVISCKIKDYISSKEDGIESGERLELKSFYRYNTKLSIGMEGDAGYYPDGTRSSDMYDYDNDYMEDGVSYLILEETKTTKYVFGVAWIEKVTTENDVQTWFGADPTLF